MQAIGLAQRIVTESEAFELAQDHQRRQPLSIRRAFVNFVAAISGMDRLDPFRALGVEIFLLMQPAEFFQPAEDIPPDRPLVKAGAALAADAAQGGGERRIAHPVAHCGRMASGKEQRRGYRIAQFPLQALPIRGNARRHEIAFFGGARGRLEQLGERLAAVFAIEQAPGVDRAGHRHRMRRLRLDLLDLPLGVPLGSGLARRPARAVQRHRRRAPLRIEHKAIAADPGALRLDDALHRHGGDRCIHRVAAAAQHVEPGQGRARRRGRDHAVGRDRRRAAGNIEVTHGRFLALYANCPPAEQA